MKKVKKSVYYKDKDDNDRTIKGNWLMSKQDIKKILDLYTTHNEKVTNISKKSCIKYKANRIGLLIKKFNKIKRIR